MARDGCKRSPLAAAGFQLFTFIIISPSGPSLPPSLRPFSSSLRRARALSSYTLIFVPDGTNLRIKRRCFMAGIHFHFRRRMIYLVALINATRDLASIYLVCVVADNRKKWTRARVCVNPIPIINANPHGGFRAPGRGPRAPATYGRFVSRKRLRLRLSN